MNPDDEPGTEPDTDTDTEATEPEAVQEVEPETETEPNSVPLEEALALVETLTAQVAEMTANELRLKAVNYDLLTQLSAGESTPEPTPFDEAEEPSDENPDSVDEALESHLIEKD